MLNSILVYLSSFTNFMTEYDIIYKSSRAYTAQQNGFVELKTVICLKLLACFLFLGRFLNSLGVMQFLQQVI